MMEAFVRWWCHLIGITNDAAVQIAVGVVGAGLLLGAIYIALDVIVGIVVMLFSRFRNSN
jgi:hypothetical protein